MLLKIPCCYRNTMHGKISYKEKTWICLLFIFTLLIFSLPVITDAQVVIKEKIKLGNDNSTSSSRVTGASKVPGSASETCWQPLGQDSANAVAGIGGLLKFYVLSENPGFPFTSNYKLWLTDWGGSHLKEIHLGIIDTTDHFVKLCLSDKFYISMWDRYSVRLEKDFLDSIQVFKPNIFTLPDAEYFYGTIGFFKYPKDSSMEFYYGFWLIMCIETDSSRIGDVPEFNGPPYTGGEVIIPHNGSYRLKVDRGTSRWSGNIVMTEPKDSLIVSDVNSHYGETFLLGKFKKGEKLRLAFKPYGGPYQGVNRYPCISEKGIYPEWGLGFSEWADFNYNNLQCILELADYPVVVKTDPEEIPPGDTARIILKLLSITGDTLDFPPGTKFYAEQLDSTIRGKIVAKIERDDTYSEISPDMRVTEPLWFIADKTQEKDTVTAVIKVTYCPVQGDASKRNVLNNTTGYIPEYNREVGSIEGIDTPDITEHKIMLGETQYFGVKQKMVDGQLKLQIQQIETEYGKEPAFPEEKDDWKWIKKKEAWDITSVTPLKSEGECGVYWELKYPLFSENDIFENNVWVGRKFLQNKDLPAGIIRLVGRFWEKDKEDDYSIRLTSNFNGKTSKVVKVIKPKTLLSKRIKDDDGFFLDEKKAKDALNNPMYDFTNNISQFDEKCIEYCGKLGIPPQIIKGQIQDESSFMAVLLYEPYKDAELQFSDDKYLDFVDECIYQIKNDGSIGNPISPNNHRVWYWRDWHNQYPGFLNTVYDVWDKHKSNYPHDKSVYPKVFTNYWLPLIDQFKNDIKTHPAKYKIDKLTQYQIETFAEENAPNLAEKDWARYLKEDYNGGMQNYIAQTRIMSSYGFLQFVYYYACTDASYPKNSDKDLPENLSLTDVSFNYSTNYLFKNLIKKLGKDYNSKNSNWKNGYESGWLTALKGYNGGGYNKRILRNSIRYIPQ